MHHRMPPEGITPRSAAATMLALDQRDLTMLILSNEEVDALLDMRACIAALETAYRELAHGQCVSAVNSDAITPAPLPDAIYQVKLMGGVIPGMGIAALRLNSDIIRRGKDRQVKLALAPGERYTGLVMLFSTETGAPLAMFPDGIVQRMRVGAASALGARYLARADAHTVGLIGAGWQAGAQVMAIAATHDVRLIRCYSPTAEKRRAFCDEMQEQTGIAIEPAESVERALRGADIVLCATNANEAVFFERWLEPGMHVGTIRGAELEPAAVMRADVIAVHERKLRGVSVVTAGVAHAENRMAIPGIDIERLATLPELIAGLAAGRSKNDQISCFLNLRGIGLQFAAVGAAIYREARVRSVGRELPDEWFTEDVVP